MLIFYMFRVKFQSPWEEVKREIVQEKGLPEDVADKIGEYVILNGKSELIDKLFADTNLTKSKSAVEGLEAMKLILKYCEIYDTYRNVSFDLSLARGLDYYTGVIYEAVLLGENLFVIKNLFVLKKYLEIFTGVIS